MPVRLLTPEEAAELRREVYGDPNGGAQMVISSSLARDMKRYNDKKKAEEEAERLAASSGDQPSTEGAGESQAEE